MDIVVLEAAGASAAAVVSGVGGKLLFNRNRRSKRGQAQTAADNAAASLLAIEKRLQTVRTEVGTLAQKLGPHARADFQTKLASVEATCSNAVMAHAEYIKKPHTDPSVRDSRGNYRLMIDSYTTLHKQLKEALSLIGKLSSECGELSRDIANITITMNQVEAAIDIAVALIGLRQSEGWDVTTPQEDLDIASRDFAHAKQGMAANEFVHCLSLLNSAKHCAEAIEQELKEWPVSLASFKTKLTKRNNELSTFKHDVTAAEALIPSIMASYSPSCWNQMLADFAVAKLRLPQVESLAEQLSTLLDPPNFNIEVINMLDKQLKELLKNMLKVCQQVLSAHDRFAAELAELRTGAHHLSSNIISVSEAARRREGNQQEIIKLLGNVSNRSGQLLRELGEPQPDLPALAVDLRELEKLVTTINRASRDRDYDNDDGDLMIFVGIGLAALGIDLLLD